MKKLHTLLVVALASFMLVFSFATPVYAAGCSSYSGAKGQVLQGVGQTGSNCNDQGVKNIIRTVVNILSFFIGAVAVIMIMVGGFKYITSGGSPEGVGNAKSTIIYALIGLAIAALAQFLVQFVLTQATKSL